MNNSELATIFSLMVSKLGQYSIDNNFNAEMNERRNRAFDKNRSDFYFYEILFRDIQNAGMKATVVTSKMPHFRKAFADFDIEKVSKYGDKEFAGLLNNPDIIRNQRKLRDCIINAGKMKTISKENGSFGEFLSQNQHNPEKLKEIMQKFSSVGPALALNFLKDIGMDFIKPDVHVLRIFSRLGLIDNENSFNPALHVAEEFKRATGEKLSVIDAVFWMYGGGGDGHIKKAICNKNKPFCNECPLTMCKHRLTYS
jgi:3-methyladenine DNA glycosylase Tag